MSGLMTHTRNNVLIIDFETTSILDQAEVSAVGAELRAIGENPQTEHVLLDFNRVDFMSSAMIGEFLAFHAKCQEKNIDVKICNLSSDLNKLFDVANLKSIFDVHQQRQDALAAF